MENKIVKIENGQKEATKELISNIKKFQKAKVALNQMESELKENFKEVMEENGIKKWTSPDGSFTVTYVAPTTSTTLDSKKIREELPEIYSAYSKTSTRAGYVKLS